MARCCGPPGGNRDRPTHQAAARGASPARQRGSLTHASTHTNILHPCISRCVCHTLSSDAQPYLHSSHLCAKPRAVREHAVAHRAHQEATGAKVTVPINSSVMWLCSHALAYVCCPRKQKVDKAKAELARVEMQVSTFQPDLKTPCICHVGVGLRNSTGDKNLLESHT